MPYTTKEEINYLDHLGYYTKHRGGKRIKCLEGYIESCKVREHWVDINPIIAINHARALLDHELGKQDKVVWIDKVRETEDIKEYDIKRFGVKKYE